MSRRSSSLIIWGFSRRLNTLLPRCLFQQRSFLHWLGCSIVSIRHHYSELTYVFSGSDVVVVEGTSHGEHKDGPWRAGVPEWGAGRWCDVFEIRDFLIQRCFIYLDPDYAGLDRARYPWLAQS